MKSIIVVCLLSLVCIPTGIFAKFQNFDIAGYYHVIKNGSLEDIEKEMELVNNASIPEKEAYEGTLLMRKAGLLKKPKEKLSSFKSGRIKLETAIYHNTDNAEYRLLRLMIQEHAPKVTKYRMNIEEDSSFIKKHFKMLSPTLQDVIKDYSKTSSVLHSSDF